MHSRALRATVLGTVVATTVTMTGAAVVAPGAMAAPALLAAKDNGNGQKITICHRTNATKNPYVQITVDVSAADGNLGNDKGKGDHYSNAAHQGPVWTPDQPNGGDWGDIIPPIPGIHEGRNWNPLGQAIWMTGCSAAVVKDDTDDDGTPDVIDPDDDGDDIPDTLDPDDDNDDVPDTDDPDAQEPDSVDSDDDGTPDVIDPDDDGDGTPDSKDRDDDGDGTPDTSDPDHEDTDGDGNGNPDTDPTDPTEGSDSDTDGDNTPNAVDPDDDNDGVPDTRDPDDDNDGVRDTRDPDDDNDGVRDTKDPDAPAAIPDPKPTRTVAAGGWRTATKVAVPRGARVVVGIDCSLRGQQADRYCSARVRGNLVQVKVSCTRSLDATLRVSGRANSARTILWRSDLTWADGGSVCRVRANG